MTKHTGKSYDDIAKKYAAQADKKPINVYFERPAFLSMMPALAGKHVLDVGCGTGWHSEYALAQGATVTAFDFNDHFVSLTQQRVGDRARVYFHAPLDNWYDFKQRYVVAIAGRVMGC